MPLLHCCHRGSRLTKMQLEGHMQNTENERLDNKMNDDNSASPEFPGVKRDSRLLLREELALLDVQQLDFRV
jgi:hypothetical protein